MFHNFDVPKSFIFFILIGLNFLLFCNLGEIRYALGQVSEMLTPDSMNETRFNDSEKFESSKNTTRVSEILTPDSINETRFSQDYYRHLLDVDKSKVLVR
ncbi:MAG TPA: hypothetical protein VF242_05610 [Nitrososphaeraceae archaeon]